MCEVYQLANEVDYGLRLFQSERRPVASYGIVTKGLLKKSVIM